MSTTRIGGRGGGGVELKGSQRDSVRCPSVVRQLTTRRVELSAHAFWVCICVFVVCGSLSSVFARHDCALKPSATHTHTNTFCLRRPALQMPKGVRAKRKHDANRGAVAVMVTRVYRILRRASRVWFGASVRNARDSRPRVYRYEMWCASRWCGATIYIYARRISRDSVWIVRIFGRV